MGKYLRIKNRGECPRLYLTLLGATTKGDRMDDPSQGGWFGSGTKFAPVAALNLGISVAVASRDEGGRYFIQYLAEKRKLPGKTIKQIVLRTTLPDRSFVTRDTPFTLDACKNWKEPIGDDGMKAFRVLREYLRNAVDADPQGYAIEECDELQWPPEGWTYVYLSVSAEIRAMLAAPARYFKYVAPERNPPPLAYFKNGAAYARSDPERTRLFSLGTLAFCSAHPRYRARYDYSVDVKTGTQGRPLLAEERTFSDMSLVYCEVKKMLAAWKDVAALTGLITAMIDGDASFEAEAMGYLDNTPKLLAAAPEWLAAWRRAYGDDAVISSNPYADELARYSFRKTSVTVLQQGVRSFLKACGVPEAAECIPGMVVGQEYRPVADLEDWERERLAIACAIMHEEFPESKGFALCVYEPMTERMKPTLGFARYDTAQPILFVQRACIRSWDTLIATLVVHECRHARTKVDDTKRDFIDRADRDLADLLIEKHGLEHEPEVRPEDISLPSVIVAKP